ncbi:unnamed protein product [Ascophyllum nodosum]
MPSTSATVEGSAYLKLMLHAAKYPWAAVSGFLLGDADTAAADQVVVKDAVPLFHTSTLSPLLETSAVMVEAYASGKGMSIIGFYQANQGLDDNTPGVLGSRIMNRIDAGTTGPSVLLLISNKRLETAGDSAVSAFTRDGNNSFRKHVEVEVSSQSVEAFESALAKQAEAGLVDMDEHFDDVKKDWRNPAIASYA